MAAPALLLSLASGFLVSWQPHPMPSLAQRRVAISPAAALDMNDPDVAEEYAAVMNFDTEQIEEELAQSGIVAPPTMSAEHRGATNAAPFALGGTRGRHLTLSVPDGAFSVPCLSLPCALPRRRL